MTTEAERFNATVGRQLRAEIAAAGESLASVARSINLSRSALDNYVTGKRDIPMSVVFHVCAMLGISPRAFVERAQERFDSEAPTRANVTPLRKTERPLINEDELDAVAKTDVIEIDEFE